MKKKMSIVNSLHLFRQMWQGVCEVDTGMTNSCSQRPVAIINHLHANGML